MTLPWPGNATLIPNVPHEVYHLDPWGDVPCLSQSIAKLMLECPLLGQAFHPRMGGLKKKETGAMARGTVLHSLVLGSGPQFEIFDYNDWKTKKSQEDKAATYAAGKVPVLRAKWEEGLATATAILRSIKERHGIDMGAFETEQTLLWEADGVRCRGRLDMHDGHGDVIDPKSHEGSPAKWVLQMRTNGADIQWAAYTEGLEAFNPEWAGRADLRYLLIDPRPPYPSCIVNVGATMRELGRARWQRAKALWAQCLETGRWPTYAEITAEARNFELEEELLRSIETVEEEYRGQQE